MPGTGAILWQVRRRPHRRMLLWAGLLGLLLAIASALLVRSLLIDRDLPTSCAVGLGLGLFLVLSLAHGSAVRVEHGGRLVYALRGHDCVAVDLRQVTAMRLVDTGALAGIGLEAPLEALEFIARKGVSRAHCEALQAGLGVALVLEFLRPEDLAPLRAAQRTALGTPEAGPGVRTPGGE